MKQKYFNNGQILIRILTHVSRVKNSNLAPVVPEDGPGEATAGAGGDNREAADKEAGGSKSSSSKVILKAEWEVLDSYLSLMLACVEDLGRRGEAAEAAKFGGQLSPASAARLAQNLLSIILLQINDPTNPEVSCTAVSVSE